MDEFWGKGGNHPAEEQLGGSPLNLVFGTLGETEERYFLHNQVFQILLLPSHSHHVTSFGGLMCMLVRGGIYKRRYV